eukprot:COSAG04_NODE_1378_length_7010_cov_3.077268_4_plen_716_part_00
MVSKKRAGTELPSATGVLGVLWHVALVGMFVVNRLEYMNLYDKTSPSYRSLLGGDEPMTPELRKEMEQLINARVGGLQSAGEAQAAELRNELTQANEKIKTTTDQLQRDIDELRGPKKRRRRRRRRAQAAQTCDARTFQARTDEAMDACCPAASGGGQGHRLLQADCALPYTCPSAECASTFTAFFDDCTDMLGANELARLRGFYANCQQLDSDAQLMLDGAEPAMIFHVLVLDDASAQAQSMFGGGGGGGGDFADENPSLDPLHPLAPPPPALPAPAPPFSGGGSGAVGVEEFQAICTKSNLATCAPICCAMTHGFLLSIQIDGRGTIMTCIVYDGSFSWQGQASLGGYIGNSFAAFFSSVNSGAAGTYMSTLSENQDVHTDLTCQPGQTVLVSGDRGLKRAPTWGSGGFTIGEAASLSLSYLQVDTVIAMNPGALSLSLDSCVLTFTNPLVLRASAVKFHHQRFYNGHLEVPSGATVHIADSTVTFAQEVEVGIHVDPSANLTATMTEFGTEASDAMLIKVNDGGSLRVESCRMSSANGANNPFPCDGVDVTCSSPHAGSVLVSGVTVLRTASPFVCSPETGQCSGVSCPELHYNGGSVGYQYASDGRPFTNTDAIAHGTILTYVCPTGRREQSEGVDTVRTCQSDGTWSGVAPSECRKCCGTCPDIVQYWEGENRHFPGRCGSNDPYCCSTWGGCNPGCPQAQRTGVCDLNC